MVYNKLFLEKDSLERVLQPLKEENKGLKKENEGLKDNLKKGKDAYNELIKKYDDYVENSKKENLRIRNEELTKELVSISHEMTNKNNLIKENDKIIKKVEQEKILYGEDEKRKGKQEIYKQIVEKYDKPFDTLVNLLTFRIVELDTIILTGYIYNKQKFIDLLNYYEAKIVLAEKFNEQAVAKALAKLSSIKQESKEIEGLIEKFKLYKFKNDELKVMIEKIKKIDARYIAYADTEDLKKSEIFSPIFSYFYNYKYNLTDYPHITKIILKIINMKERDVNQSIVHLLDEL